MSPDEGEMHVESSFARQLERELAAVTVERDGLQLTIESLSRQCNEFELRASNNAELWNAMKDERDSERAMRVAAQQALGEAMVSTKHWYERARSGKYEVSRECTWQRWTAAQTAGAQDGPAPCSCSSGFDPECKAEGHHHA
jgi:hypothetical protein